MGLKLDIFRAVLYDVSVKLHKIDDKGACMEQAESGLTPPRPIT